MAERGNRALTIKLLPDKDTDDLRLDDFLEELEALKVALRETERLVSGREPSLYFRVMRLRKDSPATVELEAASTADDARARPRFASHIVRSLAANLMVISTRKRPRKIDMSTLTAYQEMTRPLERHGLQVVVTSGKNSVQINQQFREALRSVMGDDETSYGSLSGRIEAMTTHSRNSFRLYPVVGATRVIGFFSGKDRAKFAAGMDKYVTVWGDIKYKTWERFPYSIQADEIDVHGEPEGTFQHLKGAAPNATGSMTSMEYLDTIRDE